MGLTLESELTYLPFVDRPINKTVGGLPNRLYNMNKYLFSPECDEFRREAFRMPVRIHSDELTQHSNSIAEYSVARIDEALAMRRSDRILQRIYQNHFRRGLGTLERYPKSLADLWGVAFKPGIWSGVQTISRVVYDEWLLVERRLLRILMGWMIVPLFGGLSRRNLLLVVRFIPSRDLRPIMRRVRAYQAKAENYADGGGRALNRRLR